MTFYSIIWILVLYCTGLPPVVTQGYGVRDPECGFEYVRCPCGESGSMVDIPIEKCLYFVHYRSFCRPCERYDQDTVCSQFRHCLQCNAQRYGNCQSCERGRYGNQCENECECENRGICDMHGQCQCPPNYQGLHCETRELPLCGAPPHPPRGFVDYGNITEGAVATYSCPRGYILVGHHSRVCQRIGQWSGFTPSCEYQCDVPDVGEHSHFNIFPVMVSLSRPGLEYEIELIREINFECEAGYQLQGSPKLTCLPSGNWNSNPPICVRVCVEPTEIENGHRETEGLTEGSVTRFSCDQGWNLIGDSEIVCFNGRWVTGFPRCERIVVCYSPTDIADGSREVNDDTSYNVGSSVSYRCNAGFMLRGSRIRTCLSDGQWSGQMPWCEEDSIRVMPEDFCNEPEVPANGYISNRRYLPVLAEGVRISIRCDEGHILIGSMERKCLESGEWSETTPNCIQVVTCQDPGVPRNGRRQEIVPQTRNGRGSRFPSSMGMIRARSYPDRLRLPDGQFLIHTQLIYECDSPYYELVGSKQRRCRRTGEWSGRQPTCIAVCGQSPSLRLPMIVNGTVMSAGQSPWQVGLAHRFPGDQWYIMCGASIINENWILTAGHCVTLRRERIMLDLDRIKIYLGKQYRNDAADDEHVQVFSVAEIVLHSDYSPSILDSDIALVRLNGTATFTERVRPVCLPSQDISDVHLHSGSSGYVTGWGRTEEGRDSEVLKITTVQTITNEQCETNYARSGDPQTVTSNMFCAGVEDGSTDTCTGDSGGPLVFPDGQSESKKWYLEGVVSWGSQYGCGIEMHYGGYTKVINFIEWIHNHV